MGGIMDSGGPDYTSALWALSPQRELPSDVDCGDRYNRGYDDAPEDERRIISLSNRSPIPKRQRQESSHNDDGRESNSSWPWIFVIIHYNKGQRVHPSRSRSVQASIVSLLRVLSSYRYHELPGGDSIVPTVWDGSIRAASEPAKWALDGHGPV